VVRVPEDGCETSAATPMPAARTIAMTKKIPGVAPAIVRRAIAVVIIVPSFRLSATSD
jgi:hypothetical protein